MLVRTYASTCLVPTSTPVDRAGSGEGYGSVRTLKSLRAPYFYAPHVGERLAAYFKNPASQNFARSIPALFPILNFCWLAAALADESINGQAFTHKCHMHFGESISAQTATDSNMWHSNMTVRFIVRLWDQLIHIHARQT